MERIDPKILNEGRQTQTDAILALGGNGSGHVERMSRHAEEIIETTLHNATGPLIAALLVLDNVIYSNQYRK
ncbi:MAG: hypothetical protein NUV65_04860 [Candidatus Roizmanbacteria bacterium]|nr:hypothetical protein [Candidatus Roizmanbacteria bacterium]